MKNFEFGEGPAEYIRALRVLYDNNPDGRAYYDFILRNAKEKKKESFTKEEQEELRHIFSSKYPAKACYKNAQTLAVCNPELDYVEGWADSGLPIQIEHAWNEYHGKILDVTLVLRTEKDLKKIIPSEFARKLSEEDERTKRFEKTSYYGIKIPKDFLEDRLEKTQIHGNYLGEFFFTCIRPLQKGGKSPKNCGDVVGYNI